MDEKELTALFNDIMHSALEAHGAFIERVMESKPDDMAKFVFAVNETERRFGQIGVDDPIARAKMNLCIALRDAVAVHDKVASAAIAFFKLVKEHKARRN